MPRLIPDDIGGALVPDDDGAAASPVSLMNALELARRHRMVLYRDGEPPDRGVERWPLGYRPGTQHVARLQTEVEMQRRRVVQLHDKSRQGNHGPSIALLPALTGPCLDRVHGGNRRSRGGQWFPLARESGEHHRTVAMQTRYGTLTPQPLVYLVR